LALLGLVALSLVLSARGDWAAMGILPLPLWLAYEGLSTSEKPAAKPVTPSQRLLTRLLPLWSGHIDTLQGQMGQGMEELLGHFSQIVTEQAKLDAELQANATTSSAALTASAAIATQCDAAMHGLQFGDRVHQMLDVIKADQRRLESKLGALAGMDDAAVARWLAELQAHYTTEEQHQTHRGEAPATGSGRDGVQYF
jgi:hypothetical protein